MKILLTAVNAKYIHSNLAVYSLAAYASERFACDGARSEIEIAGYTINQPVGQDHHGHLYEKTGSDNVLVRHLEPQRDRGDELRIWEKSCQMWIYGRAAPEVSLRCC